MSETTGIAYYQSPEPKGRFASADRTPDRTIRTNDGKLNYDSASATGFVEIEVPSLPNSPNATERLHVKDFGEHVISRIESSFKQPGYLRSGPATTPASVFAHYTACASGAY